MLSLVLVMLGLSATLYFSDALDLFYLSVMQICSFLVSLLLMVTFFKVRLRKISTSIPIFNANSDKEIQVLNKSLCTDINNAPKVRFGFRQTLSFPFEKLLALSCLPLVFFWFGSLPKALRCKLYKLKLKSI